MFYSHHCSQVDPRHDSPTPKSAPGEAEGEQGVQGIWSAEMECNLHSDPARKNSMDINRSLLYIA